MLTSELTQKIKQQLKDLGVVLIYLFGSVAQELEQPDSDLDLAVLMNPAFVKTSAGRKELQTGNTLKVYGDLYDILTQAFPGKKLDIVFLQRAPLELRFDVIAHGQVLFESENALRLDFEEKIMRQYADFKPILEEFNQAVLNRV